MTVLSFKLQTIRYTLKSFADFQIYFCLSFIVLILYHGLKTYDLVKSPNHKNFFLQ